MNIQSEQSKTVSEQCPRCSDLFYDPHTLIEAERQRAAEWEEVAKRAEKELEAARARIEEESENYVKMMDLRDEEIRLRTKVENRLERLARDALAALSQYTCTPEKGYREEPHVLTLDINRLGKERDALMSQLEQARAEVAAQAEVIKGAPWYSDIQILQDENALLKLHLARLLDWAEANEPEMECRGDEDCDHCHLLQLIEDAKTLDALPPLPASRVKRLEDVASAARHLFHELNCPEDEVKTGGLANFDALEKAVQALDAEAPTGSTEEKEKRE